MTVDETRIILIDDLRSFVDGRSAEVARTSAAGMALLDRYRDRQLDQLWLDHDLGEDETIWPVVEMLERAAFDECPFDVASSTSTPPTPRAPRRWPRRRNAGATTCVSRRDSQRSAIPRRDAQGEVTTLEHQERLHHTHREQ
jgi:hypothetical protein